MPIWGNLCSPLSTLCSPTTVSCTSIRRFANRPYHRTQKFSCLYGATSVLCSLLTVHWPLSHTQHRAICKSPLPQNAKILMPIWGNLCSLLSVHCSLFTALCLMPSIRQFANRPYHRTQKFSCLYEATSVHCSLTSALCSPTSAHCSLTSYQQNKKL